MNILGIETSCDETSAAVVADGVTIRSNVVASQIPLHQRWGGVVPELASRQHIERLLPVVIEALEQSSLDLPEINGIAVTNRPGLLGALLVGVCGAKSLAWAMSVPMVGVHHLDGHIASAWLTEPDVEFPFLCLLVSGGHTELVLVMDRRKRFSLGRTRDDAAGECFDKCARAMGLPYPGGPAIGKSAAFGSPNRIPFPRPLLNEGLEFSFSGLKTALIRFLSEDGGKTSVEDIAASLQAAIVEVLVEKAFRAVKTVGVNTLCVAGGVAANQELKRQLMARANQMGVRCVIPPPILCTDNAAMIAAAGAVRLLAGERDSLHLDTIPGEPIPQLETAELRR
ncbi:MAG: tRNA (adenosine(37)-N6)-threonylcarbamoyltransferase complex transferase subunit TsaD [Armatimonadetes bacterium]|nr:tRNA (adenosine(37)-N6)-threonylcarbamoyltransferase complex transferase subunit TsaD [Armatimonadota bacterium]